MEGFKVVEKDPNILWVSKDKIEDRIDCNPYKIEYMEKEKILNENLPYQTIEQLLRSTKDLTGGATPLGANYLNEGIRFIRTQNVERNYIDLKDVVYISEEDNKKLKRSILQENDILLTITGADFGRITPVTKECLPANINQHSVRIHFKENIDPYYVSVFLNSIYGQSQIFRYSVGATRAAIDYTAIKNINIPISSSEIQKYIGDKVRKAEELREEAKNLKKDSEEILDNELKLNEIKELISNRNSIKYNWIRASDINSNRLDGEYNQKIYSDFKDYCNQNNISLKSIKDFITEKIVSGSTPKNVEYLEEGTSFIRAKNLNDYSISEDLVYISKGESAKLKGSEVKSGDVLFSIAGSIGEASIIPDSIKRANINQALVRLKLEDINKYYFVFILNSSIGKLFSLRNANGAVQLNLNRDEVGDINIPILNNSIQETIGLNIKKYIDLLYQSKQLIEEAKQDVEDLIEGNFDMSKLN